LTPVLPIDELGPRLLLSLPEGSLGLLLSGCMVELRVAPDVVPVVTVPSPDAAKVARGSVDNNPAKSSEVILMFIMVVSRGESLPDDRSGSRTLWERACSRKRLVIQK
jgi:hypothetical protein